MTLSLDRLQPYTTALVEERLNYFKQLLASPRTAFRMMNMCCSGLLSETWCVFRASRQSFSVIRSRFLVGCCRVFSLLQFNWVRVFVHCLNSHSESRASLQSFNFQSFTVIYSHSQSFTVIFSHLQSAFGRVSSYLFIC